jgi:hypothetical protein
MRIAGLLDCWKIVGAENRYAEGIITANRGGWLGCAAAKAAEEMMLLLKALLKLKGPRGFFLWHGYRARPVPPLRTASVA